MPITEQVTHFQTDLVLDHNFTANGSIDGQIVDCSKYNIGVTFTSFVSAPDTDGTVFTTELYHGDDPALADAEAVPFEMLVYGRKTLAWPYVQGWELPTDPLRSKLSQEGVFSTKRYIRPKMVVTDWDGSAEVYTFVFAIRHPELIPVSQRLGIGS